MGRSDQGITYARAMSATLLLVHSPLVGPSSFRPVLELARDRGIEVRLPDLTGVASAAPTPWRRMVDVAVHCADGIDDLVVVGHSGAGAVLPQIAHRLGDRCSALIFVDAVVPPSSGAHRTAGRMLEFLDRLTVDGRLPAWIDWWPQDRVDAMVGSMAAQDELRADMPHLQRSFYDDAIPVPTGWSDAPCAYLQLSRAYDQERSDAAAFGWPSSTIDGTHLSTYTDPSTVLDAVSGLVDQLLHRRAGG
ncbi:MAG: alpha/beta hydrolase [Ilumatobacteraceae bacterium]